MKRRTLTTALIIGMLAVGVGVQAGDEGKTDGKKQTVCPVMGGKINKAEYVDVEGYRIYVCCPGCKGKIKADPEKYIKKMKAAGVEPEKAPKKEKAEHKHEDHDHSDHQH